MTTGLRIYTPSAHDFFDEVATLFINLASFNAATESFLRSSSPSIPKSPNHTLNLFGRVAHAAFPVYALMHTVVRNRWPTELPLVLTPASTAPASNSNGVQLQSAKIANLIVQQVGTAFLKYFERNSHRPKAAYRGHQKFWPEAWRFAWCLRNAIAHGDRWKIDDEAFPITTWNGVSVAHRDSGNRWYDLQQYIGGGDVLLLMEELDASPI